MDELAASGELSVMLNLLMWSSLSRRRNEINQEIGAFLLEGKVDNQSSGKLNNPENGESATPKKIRDSYKQYPAISRLRFNMQLSGAK